MDSFIKAISIFNSHGERRQVVLNRGVNIIAGKSKTGKSALLEIIDYCLCSARCTIPKGAITEYGYLYSLVMEINAKSYVIARTRWDSGDTRPMFFSEERPDFDVTSLELEYFNQGKKVSVTEAKVLIESALGLYTTNISTDINTTGKRASLRNMVSYLFQHQNLMASKFALFYRFSDYYKRKDVIEQFPVFAGIIGQEYYSSVIKLNELQQKLKQAMRQVKAEGKTNTYIVSKLLPLLKDYCALLNIDYNEKMGFRAEKGTSVNLSRKQMTAKQLLTFASDIPSFDDFNLLSSTGILNRYDELQSELRDLREREQKISLAIANIEQANHVGHSLSDTLKEIQQQATYAKSTTNQYICPLCGHHCTDISEDDAKLTEALKWLNNELSVTAKYTTSFSEDLRKAKENKAKITSQIRAVYAQIRKIERQYIATDLLQIRQNAYSLKAEIDVYVDMYKSGLFRSSDEDILSLQEEISGISKSISDYQLERRLREAESFISGNMTRIAKSLDFESEYSPLQLHFDLVDKSFDVYQRQNNGQQIFLSEMGSGANWVSCHIALFLSFLHFFTTQKKSPMPLFLFFDQPSQVYFPYDDNGLDKMQPSDLDAVDRIYKTIFDEVHLIQEDTGILPQVIIVDHVDGTNLPHGNEFRRYIRYNWFDDSGLI